jgi:hypothetical protein
LVEGHRFRYSASFWSAACASPVICAESSAKKASASGCSRFRSSIVFFAKISSSVGVRGSSRGAGGGGGGGV